MEAVGHDAIIDQLSRQGIESGRLRLFRMEGRVEHSDLQYARKAPSGDLHSAQIECLVKRRKRAQFLQLRADLPAQDARLAEIPSAMHVSVVRSFGTAGLRI